MKIRKWNEVPKHERWFVYGFIVSSIFDYILIILIYEG